MTQTTILTLQSVDFGNDDLLALNISFSLEVKDKVFLKVVETLALLEVFIGFPYWA